MAMTAAQKARHVRKEALKEWLSQQKLIEHVFDLARKIEELEPIEAEAKNNDGKVYLVDLAEFELKKYAKAAELNLKLVNKYIGDEKSVEQNVTITDERSISDYGVAELLAVRSRLEAARDAGREGEATTVHDVH